MRGSKVRRRQHHTPLASSTLDVLRLIDASTLGRTAVPLEDALGRPATPRDWRSAEVLVSRGLVQASEGRVRALPAARRVLGRTA